VRQSRRGRREKPPGVPPGPPDGASQWEATHAPLHGHASIGQFGTNAIANANDRCAGERPPGMRNPAAAVDNPATSGALKHSMKMRTAAGKVRPRRPAWEAPPTAGCPKRVATRLVQKYVVRSRPGFLGGARRRPSSKLGSPDGFLPAEVHAERKEPALGHIGTGPGKHHLSWFASQVVASGSNRAKTATPLRRSVSVSGR
jgi:hypothetical protein